MAKLDQTCHDWWPKVRFVRILCYIYRVLTRLTRFLVSGRVR